MKKIEAIIRHTKLEAVKDALVAHGVEGMTVSEVRGHGAQKGPAGFYRGTERVLEFIPRVKVETIVSDESCESVLDTIFQVAHTGEVGDGRILVTDLESVVRIRTGEVSNRSDETEDRTRRNTVGAPWVGGVDNRRVPAAMSAHF